ncbi:uncharacterized protein LOC121872611 [Homarus americanus]|uniref:uncharacterized protein LOC121872611 n=1 Tax=Homarus americanus TaxID=6706 RepID=UPI001C44956E|nr:uncharacterized protein LOC121872611 [Homarus americanus]XP_042231428.1 uncharacterized protein LOC121872611 [Homarus americanus]XP_042231429.1 uncharacterized protein LOC121872611 [Homarus americanus]
MAEAGGRQWQCFLATPGERLAYLRHSGHLSDITLTFPGHHTIIQAHRWVLAMSSPVFEAMLYGPLAEGDVLALPEDPPDAFEWLLDHLYLNHTQLPGVQLALQVYHLAAKYQMDPLCQLCSQYLVREVTPNTFPGVYEAAVLLDDTQLLARCGQELMVSSDDVLVSRDIGVLGRASLRHLLHHHQLAASSETFVFRAIITWGREQVRMRGEGGAPRTPHSNYPPPPPPPKVSSQVSTPTPGKDEDPTISLSSKVNQFLPQVKMSDQEATTMSCIQVTGECDVAVNMDLQHKIPSVKGETVPLRQHQWVAGEETTGRSLRKVVDEFLPQVRFLTMKTDEFVEHVLPSGVLTSDESVAILMNIKNIPNIPLPRFAATSARDKRKSKLNSANLLFCQHHYASNDQEILRDFQVSTTIYVTQLTAPGVTSVKDTIVKVLSATTLVEEGRWQGIGCRFDHPVKLVVGETYSVVVEGGYGPCAGCECRVTSDHNGTQFSAKTLGLTPVFLEYWEVV